MTREELSEILYECKKECGKTLDQIGEDSGIGTKSNIGRIFRCTHSVSFDYLNRVLESMGYEISIKKKAPQ